MPDPIRVLYVDDDANSLEVRSIMLEEHGFDVVTETSVADAKERLAETDVDCVLSDLDMPDQDGFDMLTHVRGVDPDLAFVLFTSHESEDVIDRILDAGATDYFAKSMTNVSYRLLAHRIRQAVRVAGADRAARRGDSSGDTDRSVGVPRTEVDPDSHRSPDLDLGSWESTAAAGKSENTASSGGDPDPTDAGATIEAEAGEALRWLDPGELNAEFADSSDEEAAEPVATADDAPKEGSKESGGFVFPAAEGDGEERSETDDSGEPEDGGRIEIVDTSTEIDTSAAGGGRPTPTAGGEGSIEHATVPGLSPAGAQASRSAASEEDREEPDPAEARQASEGPGLASKINLEAEADPAPEPSPEPGSGESLDIVGSRSGEGGDTEGDDGAVGSAVAGTGAAVDVEADRGTSVGESPVAGEAAREPPAAKGDSETETDAAAVHGDRGHPIPETFDPAPGDGVLVECGSQDERKGHACLDLLGLDDVAGRNVLLIRYRRIGDARLRRIAEDAETVHLISIGYRQSVPDDIADAVETTRIGDPGELTRLGIVMTRVIGRWDTGTVDTVVCLDSLDILMGYTDGRSVFRFLHVLLSKLRSADAIAHFHIDRSNDDGQGANTLKPLFDSIVTIDDEGVHVE